MFTVALFVIVKNWGEKTNLHQQVSLFIVVYPHKEWTIDTHRNMDESQNKYAERKKPYKRVHTVWFHVSKILKSANQTVLTESGTVVAWDRGSGEKQEEGIAKGQEDTSGCDKYALYLDYSDSFTGVHICPRLILSTLLFKPPFQNTIVFTFVL